MGTSSPKLPKVSRLDDVQPRDEQEAGLVAIARAAGKHAEDCCRTDIGLAEALRSHDALCDALAEFEAGRDG